MKTEAELIDLILKGEWRNFAILVDKYEAKVFSYTFYIMGNREDAEEVVQDTFVKAYKALGDFRGEASFSTWLIRIAHYGCLTRLRKKTPEKVSIDQAASTHLEEDGPSVHLDKEDRENIVARALNKLKPDERSVVTLFYFNELSIKEISDVTAITSSNVKVMLHRSRKKLLNVLTDMGIKSATL